MLRRALTTLFCSFALVSPAFSQDVFVPRELKAQAVHPPKPKEVVRRAQPVTDADLKALPKTGTAAAKTEKTAPKEKSAPVVKSDKAPAAADQAANKKIAKAETPGQKTAAPKEKPVAARTQTASDDAATIKVEKAPAAREPQATEIVAKTESTKEKKDKAPAKEKSDSEVPTIKVEKLAATKESSSPKAIAKSDAAKPDLSKEKAEKLAVAPKEKTAGTTLAKAGPAKGETVKFEKAAPPKDEPGHKSVARSESVKVETLTANTEKPAVKEKPATVAASKSLREEKNPAKEEPASKPGPKTETAKSENAVAKNEKPAPAKDKSVTAPIKPSAAKSEAPVAKIEQAPPREGPVKPVKVPAKSEQVSVPTQNDAPQIIPAVGGAFDTGFVKIADGFDFPVGKPEAEGYYKARGFRQGGHVGEDWDGVGGGDTDLGDPIYSVGDGIVVFARDVHLGWGNVIIVRHAYREGGMVKYIDALYGHLDSMRVSRGQRVTRGQQIATMGNAHGQYDAHLHFEIRKNLEIGMSRSKFQKDFSNYYDPTQFINSHRHLSGGGANYKVAMNTFTHDWEYHFDKNRNFRPRKRSTSESSAALRRAVTSR